MMAFYEGSLASATGYATTGEVSAPLISATRHAVVNAALRLVREYDKATDKLGFRRELFDAGADWNVEIPALVRATNGARRTWGSPWDAARGYDEAAWCAAFVRAAYRRAFLSLDLELPLDRCPPSDSTAACRMRVGSALNNQSQANVTSLRGAFESVGRWVPTKPSDPAVPGRGDAVFFGKQHVGIVYWVQAATGAPKAEWRVLVIEGNAWGSGRASRSLRIKLGSSQIAGFGSAEAASDPDVLSAPGSSTRLP
jgi:hypothetical protein